MNTIIKEKRLFSRIDCLIDLELIPLDDGSAAFCQLEAFNLSISGLGVKFDPARTRLRAGQPVLICLRGFRPVKARICWVICDRAGLRFDDALPAITESWVGEVLASQGRSVRELVNTVE